MKGSATRKRPSIPPAIRRKSARSLVGGGWLRIYLIRHAQTALFSLGRLYRSPIASLMTIAVIGIAIALPAGLYLLVNNMQTLGQRWDQGASLSLFLQQDLGNDRARLLADRLQDWTEIESVTLITPEQALAEFRSLSGFGASLDALGSNPLPGVITVLPSADQREASASAALRDKLSRLPEVELAQLDLQWVKRFHAIMKVVQRGILLAGGLLAVGVLLIVGNTIRLDIFNRREEIEVCKLIGATDAFIRRPFLYTGLWYGSLGALLAWALASVAFWQLSGPVQQLSGLYQSDFALRTFALTDSLSLLLLGIALGLTGSWLAVGRHLGAIQPS